MKNVLHSPWLKFGVIVFVALLALSILFPVSAAPASAPPDHFSVERAMSHLDIIATEPHPSGSPAQARVRDYLVQQLTALEFEVQVQQTGGVENVLARLHGTGSGQAILLQAHYDSYRGPGAADNGSGTAALLEIMRALSTGPALRNDVIALFDDSEEMPVPFRGTKAFIREHPWMADVRAVIGMDTAVRGPISVDDTGLNNGWMVRALARAYTNGAWTSMSGGGGYDSGPFKLAGVQVLELEDNYPFVEQHTPQDVPSIIRPGTLQQLGTQALAVTRAMDTLGLENTRAPQQVFLFVPYIGLLHYPQTWSLPLAIAGAILLLAGIFLAFRRRVITWKGLAIALLSILITAGISAAGINAIWKAAPKLMGWPTQLWSEWPEVIPPGGWLILVLTNLLVVGLMVLLYRFARRWSTPAGFSLISLLIFTLFSLAVAAGVPQSAVNITWPVVIGSAVWAAGLGGVWKGEKDGLEWMALLAGLFVILYIMPLIPGVFMSDGTKSVAITSGVWAVILAVILPGLDTLVMGRGAAGPAQH